MLVVSLVNGIIHFMDLKFETVFTLPPSKGANVTYLLILLEKIHR